MKHPVPLRLVGAVPAIILATVAVAELTCASRYGHSQPDDADWHAAAELLDSRWRDGELLVAAPGWMDPLLRQHLGERIDLAMATRMDAAGYPVIWELSARQARAPETEDLPVADEWSFGALEVRRYEQTPAVASYRFLDSLAGAHIDGQPAGRPLVSYEEVGFEPHRCIKVEPRPGQAVTVRFPPLPEGGTLVGYVGLADVFTRRDIRSPGQLAVELDGSRVIDREVGIDDGWRRFEAPVAAGQVVGFVISARDPRRLVCFAAEVRR